MGHWNHRVLAEVTYGELYFTIHEVHYDDDGTPEMYTTNGTAVCAESVEGIEWTLNMMQACLKKPVLWAGDKFPQEYKVEE